MLNTHRTTVAVTVVGLALASALTFRYLAHSGWDPTALIAFGDASVEITEYAEHQLGREVVTREQLGHDGRFFFVQANDPLYLQPEVHAQRMDRPAYRAQRMLFPLLAGGFGLFPATWIPWSMVGLNLASLAAGTWATARLAQVMAGPPWLGLAFAMNIGILSDIMIGAAGVLALGLAIGAALQLERGKTAAATALLVGSALTREAMLVFVAGVALLVWRRRGFRQAFLVAAIPATTAVTWAVYVRNRLGSVSLMDEVRELGTPFQGIAQSSSAWAGRPLDGLIAVALLAAGALLLIRCVSKPSFVGWGSAGFFVLSLFLTSLVWARYFDFTRALAPILTAYALVLFSDPRSDAEGERDGAVKSQHPVVRRTVS